MSVIDDIKSGNLKLGFFDMDGNRIMYAYKEEAELLRLAKIGAAMQWVSVAERLPEHYQVVDVMYDHRRETDVLFTDLGWKQYFWNPEMGRFIDGVTHWMPLPPLPETGKDE